MSWDVAGLIEQCVSGTLGLLARLIRTLGWMLLRPRDLAEQLPTAEFSRRFCPPLTFLTLGILCGFALLHDVWTLSPDSITRLTESQTGWVSWISRSLIDEFRQLTLSTVVIRTMPTVIITVLAAVLAARCLADRRFTTVLTSAVCLVIGFKLFLRLGQGLWHLLNVRVVAVAREWFPENDLVSQTIRAVTWVYLAVMAYILLLAGLRFLTAVMQQANRSPLRSVWVAAPLAWLISAGIFVGTFIAPSGVWNFVQLAQYQTPSYLLRVLPLGGARQEFSDAEHTYLFTNLLVRNETERPIFVSLPPQIVIEAEHAPIECQYESSPMLDGNLLLNPGVAQVVRVTWRVAREQLPGLVRSTAIPVVFQLGAVDEVLQEQIQTSTLQVAIDPNLLSEWSRASGSQVAEAIGPDLR